MGQATSSLSQHINQLDEDNVQQAISSRSICRPSTLPSSLQDRVPAWSIFVSPLGSSSLFLPPLPSVKSFWFGETRDRIERLSDSSSIAQRISSQASNPHVANNSNEIEFSTFTHSADQSIDSNCFRKSYFREEATKRTLLDRLSSRIDVFDWPWRWIPSLNRFLVKICPCPSLRLCSAPRTFSPSDLLSLYHWVSRWFIRLGSQRPSSGTNEGLECWSGRYAAISRGLSNRFGMEMGSWKYEDLLLYWSKWIGLDLAAGGEGSDRARKLFNQKDLSSQVSKQTKEVSSLLPRSLNIQLNLDQQFTLNTSSVLMSLETLKIDSLLGKEIPSVGNARLRLPRFGTFLSRNIQRDPCAFVLLWNFWCQLISFFS